MADTDIMKMKVADLKRELRLRGLQTTGNKIELQERLQSALIDGELSLEDTGIAEDLLDEDGLTDEDEKAVLDSPGDESVLISSSKSEEKNISNLISKENQTQPKKVVLKRRKSLPRVTETKTIATTQPIAKENTIPPEKMSKLDTEGGQNESNNNTSITDGKKVIKLSKLSMKERLEMRAKKFGGNANDVSKVSSITTSTGGITNKEVDELQIHTLKKRAERFGCVVSSKIADIEKQEKLLKRQQRFGSSGVTTAVKNGDSKTAPLNAYAEKARLRLERFKTTTK